MAAVANNIYRPRNAINEPRNAIATFVAGGFAGIIPSAFTNFPLPGGFLVGGTFLLFNRVTNELLRERGWHGSLVYEVSRRVFSALLSMSVSITIPILAELSVIDAAIICVGIIPEIFFVVGVLSTVLKICEMLDPDNFQRALQHSNQRAVDPAADILR